MEIVCLFSIVNNYDQPENNLEAWFENKPTIETLIKHFTVDLSDNEAVVNIVKLWNGERVRIYSHSDIYTSYRLQTVKEGFDNDI